MFGAELQAFESELARSFDLPFAVGVGSGTDALHLALRALGIGPGDEVITQSHSSPFTAIAIHQSGARPVYVESCEDDFGLDPSAVARALTPRTKAILPVHLYGHPVRIEAIRALADGVGLPVIEDCAQAQGATSGGRPVGTFGAIGCLSFYPTKNLAALGDGGAIVTRDRALAERVRQLGNGGLLAPGIHAEAGITSRLDELQAGVLRLRLAGLAADNDARRRHAEAYGRGLHGVTLPTQRAGCCWAPHQYVIRHPARDNLRTQLAEAGKPLLVHYPLPIHLQRGFEQPSCPAGSLPTAERLAAEVLSLPTHPELRDDERAELIQLVNAAVADHASPCPRRR